jgi:UrcA family protein
MRVTAKLLTGATMAVISLAGAAAYAQSPSDVGFQHSSLVHYSDLNLNRPQDVAKLYVRITGAADQLCGPRTLTGIHYKWAEYTSCYNDTVAQAVARIDQPSLNAYVQRQSTPPIARAISVARQ